jgi:hypothetical protein
MSNEANAIKDIAAAEVKVRNLQVTKASPAEIEKACDELIAARNRFFSQKIKIAKEAQKP